MLTKSGTKVLDFGLARGGRVPGTIVDAEASTLLGTITEDGRIVGTMPYMTPEQLQGGQVDKRTDIWALGCILHEMATGDRPFQGGSRASLIASILRIDPEPPTEKNPLASRRLDWLVKRCLEKEPDRRWHSAKDVALELQAVMQRFSAIL